MLWLLYSLLLALEGEVKMYPECFIRDDEVFDEDSHNIRGYHFHTDDDRVHYYYDFDSGQIYVRLEDLTTLVRVFDRFYLFDFITEGVHEV